MPRTFTTRGLLDAAAHGDVDHYIYERRPAGEAEWTRIEYALQALHDRGLVVWEDTLVGVRLTPKGRKHLDGLAPKRTRRRLKTSAG